MGSTKRLCFRKDNGFTLVELMVTVVVMAILLTVGIPGLGGFLRDRQLNNTVDQLSTTYNFARQEAVHRQQIVHLCALNRAAGTCRNNGNWNEGVLAFIDQNGNNQFQAGADILLRQVNFSDTAAVTWRNNSNNLWLRQNGTVSQFGRFRINMAGLPQVQLVISAVGRARIN